MSRLESSDFEEDACDILNRSGLAWLLLVGSHEHATTFYSRLNEREAGIILEWVRDGRLAQYIKDHIQRIHPHLLE
jgi:hypothetical protein